MSEQIDPIDPIDTNDPINQTDTNYIPLTKSPVENHLIYNSDITDFTGITNVILLDEYIRDPNVFYSSVNDKSFVLKYNPGSSFTELIDILSNRFTSIDRLAIISDDGGIQSGKTFFDNKKYFEPEDLIGDLSDNINEYSQNITNIIQLIKKFNIKNLDFLMCNSLKYPDWKKFYGLIQKETGIIVGASDDKTGNIKYGGDWVLESLNQDIKSIYFNDNINSYSDTLVSFSTDVLIQQKSGIDTIEYSEDNGVSWHDITAWPFTISNSTGTYLNVTLNGNIRIGSATTGTGTLQNKYFIIGSENIIFDGANKTVTISGFTNPNFYLGLLKNGDSGVVGKSNVTVKNLNVTNSGSILQSNGGWVIQQYFGNGAIDNIIEYCNSDSTCQIGTGARNGCGGICGRVGGRFGLSVGIGEFSTILIRNCISAGSILGTVSGGIVGSNSGNGGSCTIKNCISFGNIGNSYSGGIVGADSCLGSDSKLTVDNCYSLGLINSTNSGGIAGSSCGKNGDANTKFLVVNSCTFGDLSRIESGGLFGNDSGTAVETRNCIVGGWYSRDNSQPFLGIPNANGTVTNCYAYRPNNYDPWIDSAAKAALKPGTTPTYNPVTGALVNPIGEIWIDRNEGSDSTAWILRSFNQSYYPSQGDFVVQGTSSSVSADLALLPSTGTFAIVAIQKITDTNPVVPSVYPDITIDPNTGIISTTGSTSPGGYKVFVTYTSTEQQSLQPKYYSTTEFNLFVISSSSTILSSNTVITQAVADSYTWPVVLKDNSDTAFTVSLGENITLSNDVNKYFIVASENITFEGNSPFKIILDSIIGYPGLFLHGTDNIPAKNNFTIQNLGVVTSGGSTLVDDAGWIGQTYFGSGAVLGTTLTTCYSNGDIIASRAGGLIGSFSVANSGDITVTGCFSFGDIASFQGGGLFGSDLCSGGGSCTITRCYSTGTIFGTEAGGIVGGLAGGTLEGSVSTISIEETYSTGDIKGTNSGGICGSRFGTYRANASITNCFSKGAILGDGAGGICGFRTADFEGNCTISQCFSNGNINPSITAGGICGQDAAQNGGTVTVSNSYSSGILVNSSNGIYGSNKDTGATSSDCYIANGSWSDSSANTALTAGTVPTPPNPIGTVWLDIDTTNTTQPYGLTGLNGFVWTYPYLLTKIVKNQPVNFTYYLSTLTTGNNYILRQDTTPISPIVNPSTYTVLQFPPVTFSTTGVITLNIYDQTTTTTVYTFAVIVVPDLYSITTSTTINNTVLANYSWPIKISSSTPTPTVVTIDSDITLTGSDKYFIFDSDNVELKGIDNTITVTIDNTLTYPGLVQNGSVGIDGNSNTVIDSVIVDSNSSQIIDGAGWVCHSGYSYGSTDNIVCNSSSTGDISGVGSGGICGSNTASGGGSLTILNCQSSGDITGVPPEPDIPIGSGGICGANSANDGGSITIDTCTTTGDINNTATASGGLVGSNFSSNNGTSTITNSTTSGAVLADDSGGVAGAGLASTTGTITISNTSTSGNITGSYSGGIAGCRTADGGSCTLDTVSTTGDVIGGSSGGLIGSDSASNGGIINISNSTSSGDIIGNDSGGLIGPGVASGGSCIITSSTSSGDIQGDNSGGLIGPNAVSGGSCTITDSTSSGVIQGNNSGGLIGSDSGSNAGTITISDSSSSGAIVGSEAGGILGSGSGSNTSTTIELTNCISTGEISGSGAGGLIGSNSGSDSASITITNCSSVGNITGNNSGGILGNNSGSDSATINISGTNSTGEISGSGAGGILGSNSGSTSATITVENSFSSGNISGTGSGGIIGSNASNNATITINNSYSTGNISGANSGGLIGSSASTNSGIVSVTNSNTSGNITDINAGGIFGSNAGPNSAVSNTFTIGSVPSSGYAGDGIYGSSKDASALIINSYASLGTWNDLDAASTLTGPPTYTGDVLTNPIGNTWYDVTSTDFVTPWVSSSYNTPNYNVNSEEIVQGSSTTYPGKIFGPGITYSLIAVSRSPPVPPDVYPTITVDPGTGIINTQQTTATGSYGLYIFYKNTNNNSYSTSVFNLNVLVGGTPINTSFVITQNVVDTFTWPLLISGGTINNPVTITIGENIIIGSIDKYITINSDYVIVDGQNKSIMINNVSGFNGLISNGSSSSNGYSYNTIKNINIKSINSTLSDEAGWITKSYYSKAATNNLITNCVVNGIINGINSGAICGAYSFNEIGSNSNINYCYSYGVITGIGSGGIIGGYCCNNGGVCNISYCYTNGIISGTNSGGLVGQYVCLNDGIINVSYSYSLGLISGTDAGGIIGFTTIPYLPRSIKIIRTVSDPISLLYTYAADGSWSDIDAYNGLLIGTPTPSPTFTNPIGSIWISTVLGSPWVLAVYNKSYYGNYSISNPPKETVIVGKSTKLVGTSTGPTINYSIIGIKKNNDSNISRPSSYPTFTINSSNGIITVEKNTIPGTYELWIYYNDNLNNVYSTSNYIITAKQIPQYEINRIQIGLPPAYVLYPQTPEQIYLILVNKLPNINPSNGLEILLNYYAPTEALELYNKVFFNYTVYIGLNETKSNCNKLKELKIPIIDFKCCNIIVDKKYMEQLNNLGFYIYYIVYLKTVPQISEETYLYFNEKLVEFEEFKNYNTIRICKTGFNYIFVLKKKY